MKKTAYCLPALLFISFLFSHGLSKAQTGGTSGYTTYDNSLQYLRSVLQFGKNNGWATPVQDKSFNMHMSALSATDQNNVAALIKTANTNSAKFFALKSLIGGDRFATVKQFIAELNQYPETYQQQHCLVYNQQGLVQKWQYSCSISVVLTFMGDLCPRYAWDVKKVVGYDKIINDPNNDMAQQEKQLLEQYGGKASARGDMSGKSIGINGPLNAIVGNVLGAGFYAQQITGTTADALTKIKLLLDAGMDVPALMNFLPSQAAHFILFLKYKYEAGQYQFLIYEPWEGKCNYVSAANIISGSLSPLLSQWKIRLTYYYPSISK